MQRTQQRQLRVQLNQLELGLQEMVLFSSDQQSKTKGQVQITVI